MPFQILCLSGGGYLGLYSAAILAEIEEQTGRSAADMFDLFAGTSIGGIVALGLAQGRSARSICNAFLEDGPKIFGSSPRHGFVRGLSAAKSFLVPRYSPDPLRETIERVVGKGSILADLRRPTVIAAVNLTKGGPKIFKTGHHRDLVLDWRLCLSDVGLATSAAPTYFPIHRIGEELFADGGLFTNSPDLIAVHEAEHFLGQSVVDLHVLSVGTTTTKFALPGLAPKGLGILGWVRGARLTSTMIGAQQSVTNDMMRHRLGQRYVRIDQVQADGQRSELALDCASEAAKSTLLAMARTSIAEAATNETLRMMFRHTAADRPFVNASL
jgi:predicted acylesterase/phospholipase RssA